MITLALLFALYFLPTIVAAHRGHRSGGMFLLNLLLGWTGVGWLVLLFYALAAAPRYYAAAPVVYPGAHYGAWERF